DLTVALSPEPSAAAGGDVAGLFGWGRALFSGVAGQPGVCGAADHPEWRGHGPGAGGSREPAGGPVAGGDRRRVSGTLRTSRSAGAERAQPVAALPPATGPVASPIGRLLKADHCPPCSFTRALSPT